VGQKGKDFRETIKFEFFRQSFWLHSGRTVPGKEKEYIEILSP
jgi:hypothetical protein